MLGLSLGFPTQWEDICKCWEKTAFQRTHLIQGFQHSWLHCAHSGRTSPWRLWQSWSVAGKLVCYPTQLTFHDLTTVSPGCVLDQRPRPHNWISSIPVQRWGNQSQMKTHFSFQRKAPTRSSPGPSRSSLSINSYKILLSSSWFELARFLFSWSNFRGFQDYQLVVAVEWLVIA